MIPSIIQKAGPLTDQLLLESQTGGLGALPVGKVPDSTTDMVCGYCSTGCGLKIHIKDGQAISLTPTANYPVNLGMACPKGWEALQVLQLAHGTRYSPSPALPSAQRIIPTDQQP